MTPTLRARMIVFSQCDPTGIVLGRLALIWAYSRTKRVFNARRLQKVANIFQILRGLSVL